jgi:hypothetical protein
MERLFVTNITLFQKRCGVAVTIPVSYSKGLIRNCGHTIFMIQGSSEIL